MKEGIFIGELAKQAGVTIDTIRYYEKFKLLPKPIRTQGGYRVYTAATLERLLFIKQAQLLDLTLTEIAEILNFQINDRHTCSKVQSLLQQKITDVENHIKALKSFQRTLNSYLSQCNAALAKENADCCPVIEEIAHHPVPKQEKRSKPPLQSIAERQRSKKL